jgi:cell division protein FtsI (penicillin-binding protein 3)
VLALDAKVQYLAFTHLKQALAEHKAKAGGVVVLDAKTGEVLALANLPAYNPNNRVKLTGAQLRNRALTDVFEPGSTMKPFTAALALEKGKLPLRYADPDGAGPITIGNATISDAHAARPADRGAGDPEVEQRRLGEDRQRRSRPRKCGRCSTRSASASR